MAQTPTNKNHIANLAAAVSCFEPTFVNENKEQEYGPGRGRPVPPTKYQLVGLCVAAIGEIHDFIVLHERLKEEHSHFLSERLACLVSLGNAGIGNSELDNASLYNNTETLIGRFEQDFKNLAKALDILENICKSPYSEAQTIARDFVLGFRPKAFDERDGIIIHLAEPVPTEQAPEIKPESDTIPPQP